MNCTRCNGTGFLNLPDEMDENIDSIQKWMLAHPDSDTQVCDCCGNGEDWYGTLGEHYTGGDTAGRNGPYSYNGGLPECS